MALPFENELAEAEDILDENGFGFPIAWALGWMIDNYYEISRALGGKPKLRDEFKRIVKEIEKSEHNEYG